MNYNLFRLIVTFITIFLCRFLTGCSSGKENLSGAIFEKLVITDNWLLQSSVLVRDKGSDISTINYDPKEWFEISVPVTVLNALIKNGIYPDPRIGLNSFRIPDSSDEFNKKNDLDKFSYLPDKRNPWRDPYWYRTEFTLPDIKPGRFFWLNFNCINYRADVWLNGSLIAEKDTLAGMFRRFRFDITDHIKKGNNALAVLIYPVDHPGEPDTQLEVFGKPRNYRKELMKDVTEVMSIGYDCFPTVPDRNMGIIQEVYIENTGPVDIRNPFIVTDLPLPETNPAYLKLSTELVNVTDELQKGVLKVTISEDNTEFSKEVELAPGETKEVVISSGEYSEFIIDNPRLWWPVNYGDQNLYNMSVSFDITGRTSDTEKITFGVREISKELHELDGCHGLRFHLNGKKIFCRGGYIQPEMMFEWDSKRIETEIRYLTEANLNWVCFEDIPNPPDEFMELCDRYGLMFWNDFYGCYWLQPGTDYPSDLDLLERCTVDLIYRYRNHPSLTLYMSMNEGETREEVYTMWRKHIIQLDGTRLFIPSGSFPDYRSHPVLAKKLPGWLSEVPEWIKQDLPVGMNDYPPKSYGAQEPETYFKWVSEERNWMFMLESGSASLPPVNSLKQFIPDLELASKGDIYPLNSTWAHHGANSYYEPYDEMLRARYGSPVSVTDYCRKGHLLTAEQHRAMFEAVNHRMWDITSGFGEWKLNSGWPSIQWQIYDWYHRPMVSYYYIKKACAPLVVQLNPVNSTVTIVNNSFEGKEDLQVTAKIYDFSSRLNWEKTERTSIGANTYKDVITLDRPNDPGPVYFVGLEVKDSSGGSVSDNFYWISSKQPDDLSELVKLPPAELIVSYETEDKGKEDIIHIRMENPTDKLAFFIHALLTRSSDGEEVLPVFWDDNYFSLLPGEKKYLKVAYAEEDLEGSLPIIEVEGWNTKHHIVRK